MRRVLFISHAVEFAGAEIALVRFIRLLDRTRYEPVLLLPRVGDLQALLDDIPARVVWYDLTLHYAWDDPRLLAQIAVIHGVISAQQPDLVVVNTNTIPQTIIAALTTDIPLLVHLHGFVAQRQYAALPDGARTADALWLPAADHVIACSGWVAGMYAPLLGRPIPIVPNTVPPVTPAPYPLTGTRSIVMLASLEDNKRPELFIAVAAQLRRQYPTLDFRCQLYGDGTPAYAEYLHTLLRRQRLTDRFTIQARVPDTTRIYQTSAAVFVPSVIEPFSLVAIEAAAHSRPLVATRSGGPDDIVIDGETGYLIDIDNTDAAVTRLAGLLLDPALAARLGQNARTRYEAHYAPQRVADHYHAALVATLQNAAAAPERRRTIQPLARYFLESAHVVS